MENHKGIEQEFNMDLKSKERVHDLLNYLNKAPIDPILSRTFTPEMHFKICMALYRETKIVLKQDERDMMDDLKKTLTEKYNSFMKHSLGVTIFQKAKSAQSAALLNLMFDEFEINLMQFLQNHQYIYKEASPIGRAVLKR